MILDWLRKACVGSSRSKWDREYAAGRWDYFTDPLEAGRYEAILFFIDKYFKGGAILEVGCGEGILQARMKKGIYTRFQGIDISKVAIRKALRFKDGATDYRYGDMEMYVPSRSPDLVIFNEVLYYSADPVRLVRRYAGYLRPGGIIISSCFGTEKSLKIMTDIEKEFPLVNKKVSANERGTWHCRVYAKSDPAAGRRMY
jgi:2-polyprenyl-3-methyl-5-hydroxy-6-metoxy-1,4-benzoquinol methylase